MADRGSVLLEYTSEPCEWDKAVVAALNEITKKEK